MLVPSRICDFSDTCNVTVFKWISSHLKADNLPEPQEERINWDKWELCQIFALQIRTVLSLKSENVPFTCYATGSKLGQCVLPWHIDSAGWPWRRQEKTWSSLLSKWKCKTKPLCKYTSLILHWQRCWVFEWMQWMSQRCSMDTRMGFITHDFRDK